MLRRDFLLSIGLSPLAGAATGSALSAPGLAPSLFIYDERFELSRALAQRAAFGAPQYAIKGDVTALWLHDLHARWSRRGAAVAGVTTERALFCLDLLARDHSLRVLARRDIDGDTERLVAWVIGPSARAKGIA